MRPPKEIRLGPTRPYDVIVCGAGHAGVEAALAKLNEARHATDAPFNQLAEARKPIDALKVQMVAAQNRQREQSTLAQIGRAHV